GRLLARKRLVLLALDELDRVVDEVRVEVLDLLLRQLDLVEAGDDLVVREEPFLEPVLDETVQLFDFRQRDVDGQHGHWLSPSSLEGILTCRHASPAPPAPASVGARGILVGPRKFGKYGPPQFAEVRKLAGASPGL